MKKKEDKYYHKKDGICSACSEQKLTKKGNHDKVNLTWDEIQPYINPEKAPGQLARIAQSEMIKELDWSDIEISKQFDGHSRRISTVELLRAYKNACRDYVRNVDGVLTISGNKPVRPE
jgi:hypothetical protein